MLLMGLMPMTLPFVRLLLPPPPAEYVWSSLGTDVMIGVLSMQKMNQISKESSWVFHCRCWDSPQHSPRLKCFTEDLRAMLQGQHRGGRIHIVNAVHAPILSYSLHIHFMTSQIIVFWIDHIAVSAVCAVRRPIIVMMHIHQYGICSVADVGGDDRTVGIATVHNATAWYVGHVFGEAGEEIGI